MNKIKLLNHVFITNAISIPKDTILEDFVLVSEHIPTKPWEEPKDSYHNIEIIIKLGPFDVKAKIWKYDFEWIEKDETIKL